MNGYYDQIRSCTAFASVRLLRTGTPREVAIALKALADDGSGSEPTLIFDDETGGPVEFDLRGALNEVLARVPELAAPAVVATDAVPTDPRRKPGRPKLGVVAREVTLLPRHWEWLASQPGGASVTLRKLVESARKSSADEDRARLARDATYRVMFALAGNEAGFEEASRALFAGDAESFAERTREWPDDVKAYLHRLAQASFTPETERAENK